MRTSSTLRLALLAALPMVLAACVGGSPGAIIPPPDTKKLIVFFQLDGIVHGRGLASALPPGTKYLYVKAHPSGTETVEDVRLDGSFIFSLAASSNDLLEISGSNVDPPSERGEPSFFRVPRTPFGYPQFICCRAPGLLTGSCIEVDPNKPCTGNTQRPNFLNPCSIDGDCAHLAGEVIPIPDKTFEVTPPNDRGRVTLRALEGKLPALSLVSVQDRGQRAVGGDDPGFRVAQVSDDLGTVELNFTARGDDELVVQVYDFGGYKSRAHAEFVPDSPLKGVDIVGVFPFNALTPGERGVVAVRFAPFGEDNRGICPDSKEEPALCFSAGGTGRGYNGGLDNGLRNGDQGHVRISRFAFDGRVDAGRSVSKTTTQAVGAQNKFTDGDLLGGPQVMYLVIDHSAKSNSADPMHLRYRAAENFITALRSRDQLGIWALGEKAGHRLVASPDPNRTKDDLINQLKILESQAPIGEAKIFEAIQAVGKALKEHPIPNGRIVMISTQSPTPNRSIFGSGTGYEFDSFPPARDEVLPNEATLFQGIRTFIATLNLNGRPGFTEMKDIADFSGGAMVDVVDPSQLLTAVADITGILSGAFVLLYDIDIPAGVGKAAQVEINAEVTISGIQKPASYKGVLEIQNANP